MKKITPLSIVAAGLSSILLVIACSKDFDEVVEDSFDFSFTERHEQETFIFEATKTDFSLEPDRVITGVEYYMKYNNINGGGYYVNAENDTIRENDTIFVNEFDMSFNFVPIDTGAVRVKMLAWDSNKLEKELDLLYNSNFASFSFLLAKGSDEFIINSKNPLSATLLRDKETGGSDWDGSFEVSYQIEDGTGKLYLDGASYDAGKTFALPKGVTEFGYLPETLGDHKIIMTAKAPDGATLTQELIISVVNLGFIIKSTAASTQIELDTNLAINIDLTTQDDDSDVTYEISHAFASESEGAGTVRNQDGAVMDPGQYRNIEPGSYNYTFTSTVLGKRKIYFDARDSNGQIKKDSVEIEVANIPFTFSGSAESNSVFIGEQTQFNFNIKSNGNTDNIEYTIAFDILEGNGRLTGVNGNTMQSATDYPVGLGNFSLFYYPETLGSHKISFVVTDNYGQASEPVIVDLETKQNDFEVSITPSKTTEFSNIPISTIINIDEIPEGTNDTYTGFFSSSKNAIMTIGGVEFGPGEKFPLNPEINTIFYTGVEPGQHNIVLSVESGSEVTHTAETTINYEQVDFNFTGGAQKTEISVGETTSLNFNISETVGSSNYTMRFTMNGNAIIRDHNDTEVSPGNIYQVPKGNFNWSIEGTDPGTVSMTFYAKNDTGLEKPAPINVTVTAKDYTFTASATQSQAFTNDAVDINFNISEIGIGGDTYTMYFSSGSNNASFEYDGQTYAPGETFSVPVGSFSGIYTGLSEGNHNIVFNVRSSSDVPKAVPISIQFEDYEEPFTLTITQSAEDKYINDPFTLTVVTNASSSHNPETSYTLSYDFADISGGFVIYKGSTYRAGEEFAIDYGTTVMQFYPETDENFTVIFRAENSTGQSATDNESVIMFKKPLANVKGEKHNVSCGGLNGCDYEVRIYTCWDVKCSEAYNGAALDRVEIRIFNRKDNRWDVRTFNYGEAQGTGVNRYFLLEKEPSENKLKYLDQEFRVRILDTNGEWSNTVTGFVQRV